MAYHKKTGNYYKTIGVATDATNGREDDEQVVIYERCGKLFVRKASEFKEKFSFNPIELPMAAERGE